MKLAIICPDDLSIVLFSEEIIKQLKDKDYDLTVITDRYKNNNEYIDTIKKWGCNHITLSFYRFLNPIKDLMYMFRLNKIIKKGQYEIVFNISTKPNIYGTIIAKRNKVNKIICAVWGFGITSIKNNNLKDKLVFNIFKSMYNYAFHNCDKIWFTNPNYNTAGILNKNINQKKITLTKNYVNTDQYSTKRLNLPKIEALKNELGIKPNEQSIVMISRMSWTKGVKEFIEAAEIIVNKEKNIHFLLVGPLDVGSTDSISEQYIHDKVQKIDKLQWLGFRKDTINLYGISTISVYPTYYPEGGYPRGITEPMSMGKAVIATDNDNCKNTIDNGTNGILVPQEDSVALANAVLALIRSPDRLEKIGLSARQKVISEFDEKTIITDLFKKLEM